MGTLGVDPIVVFGFRTSGILLGECADTVRGSGPPELSVFLKTLREHRGTFHRRATTCFVNFALSTGAEILRIGVDNRSRNGHIGLAPLVLRGLDLLCRENATHTFKKSLYLIGTKIWRQTKANALLIFYKHILVLFV